jgi:PhnB protein
MSQALTPFLVSPDAAASAEFYKKAFGAEEVTRHAAPDGRRLMHVHLRIMDSDLMLADDFSDKMGCTCETPDALGGNPITLHLHTNDADTLWNKAVEAGAVVTMPLKDQFWGDRYGQLKDPFGYKWSIGQTISTPSTEEVEAGAKASALA